MLTVDFDAWGVQPGELVLDLGSGGGRHTYEVLRRSLNVVSVDLQQSLLRDVRTLCGAMIEDGQAQPTALAAAVQSDALALPFPDGCFDRVIAAEVLEHIEDDGRAMREIARVLKPGGSAAVSVPRWWPERVCWALSDAYHAHEGGHVRIYTARELTAKLTDSGFAPARRHHAHALHSPYWWLRCVFGITNERSLLPRAYHRLLVWDLTRKPALTRVVERALDPLLGKSLVLYLEKSGGDGIVG